MDDSTDDVETRIRSLGQLRSSTGARSEAEAVARLLEDRDVRVAAERTLPRRLYRPFSRTRRAMVTGVIVVAGLGLAAPAAALTAWLARTGEFGDPSTSTEVDDTEWIDLGAPDAPQVSVDAYPDYLTLPPGVPPEAAIEDVSRIFGKLGIEAGGQGRAQEGLMTQTYEFFALCAWTSDWLSAHDASDAARMEGAATWLGDTDNYPSVVAHDGGGVTDSILRISSAARDGDVRSVERAYDMQSCDTHLGEGQR